MIQDITQMLHVEIERLIKEKKELQTIVEVTNQIHQPRNPKF